jgi:hypothetical protein
MDHKVIPRLCKICDWLLNLSRDHFGLHQGKKKCQRDHGVQGPQNVYEKAYIIYSHGPTGFVLGEPKRGVLVEKGRGTWQKNVVVVI